MDELGRDGRSREGGGERDDPLRGHDSAGGPK